jgi:hypothetical protein
VAEMTANLVVGICPIYDYPSISGRTRLSVRKEASQKPNSTVAVHKGQLERLRMELMIIPANGEEMDGFRVSLLRSEEKR